MCIRVLVVLLTGRPNYLSIWKTPWLELQKFNLVQTRCRQLLCQQLYRGRVDALPQQSCDIWNRWQLYQPLVHCTHPADLCGYTA